MKSKGFAKHREKQNRQRQSRADPKAQPHRVVLRIGLNFREQIHGFEGHATLWAYARAYLHNLRMHGAGVAHFLRFGWCRRRRGFRCGWAVVHLSLPGGSVCVCVNGLHARGTGRCEKFLRLL